MTVIIVLIGVSIVVAGGFLAAFLWAVRAGQYDDNYTPSVRILFDDAEKPRAGNAGTQQPTPRAPDAQDGT